MGVTWPPAGWTDQNQVLQTPQDIHGCLLHLAESVVGIGPADLAYRQLCWPYDPDSLAARYARHMSACALVAAGLVRCLGFEHPLLDRPYVVGSAMAVLQQIGAWYPGSCMPQPGEIAIIGMGGGTHALTVLEWDEDIIVSVDGGRGTIRQARRQLVSRGDRHGLLDQMGLRWVVGVLRVREIVPTRSWCEPPQL